MKRQPTNQQTTTLVFDDVVEIPKKNPVQFLVENVQVQNRANLFLQSKNVLKNSRILVVLQKELVCNKIDFIFFYFVFYINIIHLLFLLLFFIYFFIIIILDILYFFYIYYSFHVNQIC